MQKAGTERIREFHFKDEDFEVIRNRINHLAGIKLGGHKREMVYSRLARRLRVLKLNIFEDYLNFLEKDEEELVHFVNSLTTNLTSFFRESHHFDYMKETVIPEIIKSNSKNKTVRIWSAGCSSGEEAYSIAMTLCGHIPHWSTWDIKILATDLDTNVLKKGREGIYELERVSDLSSDIKSSYFNKGKGTQEGYCRVKKFIREMVVFNQLNFIEESWNIKQPFDLIFCRNVLIYFDQALQQKVLNSLLDHLTMQGHLFLGHSESAGDVNSFLDHLGRTWYRKISSPNKIDRYRIKA